MVVFDATILLPVLWPEVPVPKDPANNNQPVDRFRERIDHLVETLDKDGSKVIIPTPVLSEILVRAAEAGPEYLEKINGASAFRIVPFDTRAAVEVAAMSHGSLRQQERRRRGNQTIAKLKYDRQIVAIAKVEGASVIYSDDRDLPNIAATVGLSVIRSWELPLPEENPQGSLWGGENTGTETENPDKEAP